MRDYMSDAFRNNYDMPVGLKMALSSNIDALRHFAGLSAEAQACLISESKRVNSEQEMRMLVDGIPRGY